MNLLSTCHKSHRLVTNRGLWANVESSPVRRFADVVALIRLGQVRQLQVCLVLRVAADALGDELTILVPADNQRGTIVVGRTTTQSG